MYYVPDGTKRCGFYECRVCGGRFLSVRTDPKIACPDCERDADMEIGPDEDMAALNETAELLEVVEGEDVEKMDRLLSLAITGGDYEWL